MCLQIQPIHAYYFASAFDNCILCQKGLFQKTNVFAIKKVYFKKLTFFCNKKTATSVRRILRYCNQNKCDSSPLLATVLCIFCIVPGKLLIQVQATAFGDFSFTTQTKSWLFELVIKTATSIKLSCTYILATLGSVVNKIAPLWQKIFLLYNWTFCSGIA